MAQAARAVQARAGPMLCQGRALLPGYLRVVPVMDHQRLGAQPRRDARHFQIRPAHAEAFLDRRLHRAAHALGDGEPTREAARIADQVRGRADQYRALDRQPARQRDCSGRTAQRVRDHRAHVAVVARHFGEHVGEIGQAREPAVREAVRRLVVGDDAVASGGEVKYEAAHLGRAPAPAVHQQHCGRVRGTPAPGGDVPAAMAHKTLARIDQVEELAARVKRLGRGEEQLFGPQAGEAWRDERGSAQAEALDQRFKQEPNVRAI